jgi:hypothetical protein
MRGLFPAYLAENCLIENTQLIFTTLQIKKYGSHAVLFCQTNVAPTLNFFLPFISTRVGFCSLAKLLSSMTVAATCKTQIYHS